MSVNNENSAYNQGVTMSQVNSAITEATSQLATGYTPKGEATVATLNGLSGQENGWLYTMTDAGTLTDGTLAVVAGDTVAWDEANSVWYKAMDYAPSQYGTNEVHNLPTTITAFRTGDYIAVDGTSGTAKMSKDDLLNETKVNALRGIHSLSQTATEDDLVSGNYIPIDGSAGTKKLPANFIPASKIIDRGSTTVSAINSLDFKQDGWRYTVTDSGTLSSGNLAVVAGDSVVWNASNSKWVNANAYLKVFDWISSTAVYSSFDDFPVNSVLLVYTELVNNPEPGYKPYGVCYTFSSTLHTGNAVQVYISIASSATYDNKMYHRVKINNTWGDWKRVVNNGEVITKNNAIGSGSAITSFDDLPDGEVMVAKDLSNSPSGSYLYGYCFTEASFTGRKAQMFVCTENNTNKSRVFFRAFHSTWSDWKEMPSSSDVSKIYGFIGSGSPITSFNDLPLGQTSIFKDLSESPDDAYHPWGIVFTFGSKNNSNCAQILITTSTTAARNNLLYYRSKRENVWSDWKLSNEGSGGGGSDSPWNGKNIVWFGTSIPAGGGYDISNPNSYPIKTGSLLGASHTYNEAVGSSSASIQGSTDFTLKCKGMANTIQQELDIINDTWTIDDSNQTFEEGPRTLNLHDIPSVSSYSDVVKIRATVLSYSYEIKLVARYLISDSAEHDNYLKNRLGNDLFTILSTPGDSFLDMSYKDIDLFVFDHGHNDSISTSDPDYREIPIDSTSTANFIGAMNLFIGLVYKYQPKKRIIIVGDYDDFQYKNFNYYTIITTEIQKKLADNWHLPFVAMKDVLPFNNSTIVKTRGYWDSDGYWHETGFTWSDETGTTAFINSFLKYGHPDTVAGLKEAINPTQDSDGTWWYEVHPRDIWLKDGLHPHSDKTWKSTDMYARELQKQLSLITP